MLKSSQVCACSISVFFYCIVLWLWLLHHAPSLLSGDPYFRDLSMDSKRIFMSPYVLATQTAENLGLDQLAVQYAHEALIFHKNPVKMYHGHVKLGGVLRGVEKE